MAAVNDLTSGSTCEPTTPASASGAEGLQLDDAAEPDHLAYLLHRTIRRMRLEGALLAGDLEALRASESRLLDLLPAEGARVTDMSTQLGISKQALGQLAVRLTAAGYVEMEPDPGDRRARVLRRTARGDAYRQAVRAALEGVEDGWRSQVGAERYATFRAVLAALAVDGR